jgi:methyltransferase-like protein/SAM-dependent methyltransferase
VTTDSLLQHAENDQLRAAYETVLYPSLAVPQTHPDRLATIATLFGMTPAPADRCRVLEIGCGDGANLLGMAATLPQSEFLGIDFAPGPIAAGQAAVEELKLSNLRLAAADLMQISAEWGQFDYIIAHGVYSWVPEAVREKLLAVFCQNLAPQGVAFVSHNTTPGSHLRAMLREMMLFHVHDISDPHERVAQARSLVQFVVQAIPETDLFRGVLQSQLEDLQEREDAVVYHDDLAEVNCGASVSQLVERARSHGLEFLGDAEFSSMCGMRLRADVREQLELIAENDYVRKEQLLDYLNCRSFRRTLLCDRNVPLRRKIGPDDLSRFHLAMNAHPAATEPELAARGVQRFTGPKQLSLATDHPLAKAALSHLGQIWPGAIAWNDLLKEVSATPDAEATSVLGNVLWGACCSGMLELYLRPPRFATKVHKRPKASALARWQAWRGTVVTNLCHKNIEIKGALERHLLQLLNGTRTHAQLATDLAAAIDSGQIVIAEAAGIRHERQNTRSWVETQLGSNLAALVRLALLET